MFGFGAGQYVFMLMFAGRAEKECIWCLCGQVCEISIEVVCRLPKAECCTSYMASRGEIEEMKTSGILT